MPPSVRCQVLRNHHLRLPKPSDDLTPEYRRKSIRIGDVGILTPDGGFDFLFNICLPPDHPLNCEGVPHGFEQLVLRPGAISTTDTPCTTNSLVPASDNPYHSEQLGGADLLVPRGSPCQDLLRPAPFREHVKKYASTWYDYVHENLRHMPQNSCLCLVTGCDQPRPSQPILMFFKDTLPRQVYLNLLLRLPLLYFSRAEHVYEHAEASRPDIVKMSNLRVSQALQHIQEASLSDGGEAGQTGEPSSGIRSQTLMSSVSSESTTQDRPQTPRALAMLGESWEFFVKEVISHWHFLRIGCGLLLTTLVALLQITSISENSFTRTTALTSLVCALISLLAAYIFLVYFGAMESSYRVSRWSQDVDEKNALIWRDAWILTQEARKSHTLILWNVWVFLSMPAVWISWSIFLFATCMISFVWSPDQDPTDRGVSTAQFLGPRVMITSLSVLGALNLTVIVITLKNYAALLVTERKRAVHAPCLDQDTRRDYCASIRGFKLLPSGPPPLVHERPVTTSVLEQPLQEIPMSPVPLSPDTEASPENHRPIEAISNPTTPAIDSAESHPKVYFAPQDATSRPRASGLETTALREATDLRRRQRPPISIGRSSKQQDPRPSATATSYAMALLQRRSGYPLWFPEPSTAPPEHRVKGVRIGDVGMITPHGAFDYLFNVCLAANHPLNCNGVPEGFEPFELKPDMTSSRDMRAGTIITSPSVKAHSLKPFEPSGNLFAEGAETGVVFTCSTSPGAVLCLPDGASSHDLEPSKMLRRYTTKHARSWYIYANQTREWKAPNGSLFLVTGHDTTNSWRLASFSDAGRVALERGKDRSQYAWTKKVGMVDVRSSVGREGGTQSYCVLIRGFKLSVQRRPSVLRPPIALLSIVNSKPEEIVSHSTTSFPVPGGNELVQLGFRS